MTRALHSLAVHRHGFMSTLLLLAMAIAGCRTTTPPAAAPAPREAVPVSGAAAFEIDAAASSATLYVYREGPMAALGHNHIIVVRDITGTVSLHPQPERSQFELKFPVNGMLVDPQELRSAAGEDFASNVNDAARNGTRTNMLGAKLLEAERHPFITLRSAGLSASAAGLSAQVNVRVRDRDSAIAVPLTCQQAEETLKVSGEFRVRQTELGLTPYSVAFGALRVADEIRVEFNLVARRRQT